MNPSELTTLFDQQAASYDSQWSRLAPINHTLHLLTGAVLAQLPATAKILCVGAGTGVEILYLAKHFPGWHFTAVEPSSAMLQQFRHKAEQMGILSRCELHTGYLDSLPEDLRFDAATSFLVSQFILDRHDRTSFFQQIANRLRPDGLLVSSDLAGDLTQPECESLLEVWFQLMSGSGISSEGVERMRAAYQSDVAVLPPDEVSKVMQQGGFFEPVRFFQAGMIHAWFARRSR